MKVVDDAMEAVALLEDELDRCDAKTDAPTMRLPTRYRRAAAALALAQSRGVSPDDVDVINRVVVRAHHELYRSPSSFWRTMMHAFEACPVAVRRHWRVFGFVAVLFFGTFFGTAAAVRHTPSLGPRLLGNDVANQFAEMYGADAESVRPGGVASDVEMFGFYVNNNTGIGLRTLAMGAAGGVGSLYVVVSNGYQIGATLGHLDNVGHGERIRAFMASHGPPELVAIVLAGGAGWLLGLSVLFPGRRRRRDALAATAKEMLPVLYCMAALFVFAAVIEAFWSANNLIAPSAKYVTGAGLSVALFVYFFFVGPRHAAP